MWLSASEGLHLAPAAFPLPRPGVAPRKQVFTVASCCVAFPPNGRRAWFFGILLTLLRPQAGKLILLCLSRSKE
ncbi:hypothetical protein V8C40DRAFT_236556 [Trichoderma camerunense]